MQRLSSLPILDTACRLMLLALLSACAPQAKPPASETTAPSTQGQTSTAAPRQLVDDFNIEYESGSVETRDPTYDQLLPTKHELNEWFQTTLAELDAKTDKDPKSGADPEDDWDGEKRIRRGVLRAEERCRQTIAAAARVPRFARLTYPSERVGIRAVAFSPDGKLLVTNGPAGQVWIADWSEQAKPKPFSLHSNGTWLLDHSADGKTVVTAGNSDKTIKLWNLPALRAHGEVQIEGMEHLHRFRLGPDGKELAISWDGQEGRKLDLWDTTTLRRTRTLRTLEPWKWVEFSPDSKVVALAAPFRVGLWERDDTVREINLPPMVIHALAWFHDGKRLALGGRDYDDADELVKILDVESGQVVAAWSGLTDSVRTLAISSDDRLIVTSACFVPIITLRELDGQKRTAVLLLDHPASDLALSPNGTILATCSSDENEVSLWKARDLFRHAL